VIHGQVVEQVSQFMYLGSMLSGDGYCEQEKRDGRNYLWITGICSLEV